jgi:hypothetical protein
MKKIRWTSEERRKRDLAITKTGIMPPNPKRSKADSGHKKDKWSRRLGKFNKK